MATSGRMQGNSLSIGGYGGQYYFIDWSRNGNYNIGGNYSPISWNAYFHYNVADAQLDNGNAHLNGNRWSNGGRVKNFAGTYTTRNHHIAGGSFNLGHNSAGAANIDVSGGISAYQSGRSSGSQTWSLPTIPRNASITGGSSTINDTQNPTLNWSNPAGNAITTLQVGLYNSAGTIAAFPYTNVSKTASSYTINLSEAQRNVIRGWAANSKSITVRMYLRNVIGGVDERPYRNLKVNIINGEPTFSNFTYQDTNAATVAVTGNNQVLIQNKSTLHATVSVANRAIANKQATMKTYSFTVGGYSASSNWSNSANVVHNVGVVSDVSGVQNLSARALDSRGNSRIVTKSVNILPYTSPGFYGGMMIKYANDFDVSDGIVADLFNNNTLGSVSPLTLGESDINSVSELSFDMSKDSGAYTGTPVNIPFTQTPGTGQLVVDPEALATAIQVKMNGMVADNTVRWGILFKVTDKLETQYFTATIDVGRPFFRIGADGRLYYKEIEFFDTFSGRSDRYYPSLQAYSTAGSNWRRVGVANFLGGWAMLLNSDTIFGGSNPGSNGDEWMIDCYVPAGVYVFSVYFLGSPGGAKIDLTVNGAYILGTGFDTYDSAGNSDKVFTSGAINVLDGATYTLRGKVNGRNPANTTDYRNGLFGVKLERVGSV